MQGGDEDDGLPIAMSEEKVRKYTKKVIINKVRLLMHVTKAFFPIDSMAPY
jgi:hypothetical protein